MCTKPGTGVFLVRIFGETGIRKEIAGRPLPHIADHLPAPELGIAFGMAANIATTTGGPIEISLRTPIDSVRRDLPFEFGGQASGRPAAVRVGFKPAHIRDRAMRFQCDPSIKMPANPTSFRISSPVHRVLGLLLLAPGPTRGTPKVTARIAAIFHEA